MAIQDARQAGDEIEVTEEMIRAGAFTALEFGLDRGSVELMVELVYEAMERVRLESSSTTLCHRPALGALGRERGN